MVEDCLTSKSMIAVTTTPDAKSEIRNSQVVAKDKRELYRHLNQNLTDYQPSDIFSAGIPILHQTTEDGRYHISIEMDYRFRLIEEIDHEPYRKGICEEYLDNYKLVFEQKNLEFKAQRDFIIETLIKKSQHYPDAYRTFMTDLATLDDANLFTFKLFQFVRFEDELMQRILLSKDPAERLSLIFRKLKSL